MMTKPNETAEAVTVACTLAQTVTGILTPPTTTWLWIATLACCILASAILAVCATVFILKKRQNRGQKQRGGGGAPNPWHQKQECCPPLPRPSSAGATATGPEGGTTSGSSRPDKDPLLTQQRRRRQAAGGIIMGDGDNGNASGVAAAAATARNPRSRLHDMISQRPWSAVVAAMDIHLIDALAPAASASPAASPASCSGTAVDPVFIPFTELAEATCVDRDRLLRLLRYLCTLDITSCSPADPLPTEASAFGLTPMGRLLHDDPLTCALVGFQRSPVVARFPENYGEVVRTGKDVHVLAFGMDWNTCMRDKKGYAAAFTGLMRQRYRRTMPAIAEAWDFSATRRVVDVGGGTGALGVAVLSATQASSQVHGQPLLFQVLDLPQVVQAAPGVPTEFAGQLEYVGGSFFNPSDIPAGADAYVVNGVLHDWPDDQCVGILSNLAAAADRRCDSGSAVPVVLVVDHVLRADDPAVNRTIAHDFAMMKFTGRHRTAAEFRELLRRAGLLLRRTVTLSVPNMQLFEAVVASAEEDGASPAGERVS